MKSAARVTFMVEAWTACFAEMSALWNEHWEEVAINRDQIKLDPDLDQYRELERTGALHVVVARERGAIVGYHISIVRPHLHYRRSLSAFTDVYFLRKSHRHGMTGVRLIKAAEETLRARGVQKMFTGTKLTLDMGPIFQRLGWTPTETLYTKMIGAEYGA